MSDTTETPTRKFRRSRPSASSRRRHKEFVERKKQAYMVNNNNKIKKIKIK
jgi:hypothetical protein